MTYGRAVAHYLTFLAFATLLAIAPGPDTFFTLRMTVAGGRIRGLWTVFGIIAANVLLGVLAASGLGALITQSHRVFDVLRWVGVLYLAYLGISAIIAASRGSESAWTPGAAGTVRPTTAIRQGFLCTMSNPKVMVFYVAVLPPFVSPDAGIPVFMAYALTLAAIGVVVLLAVVFAASTARRLIQRAAFRRGIDGGVGVVMLGFAAALALDN
jgi:threonine/homoserine/homoserine lactone efflux protein